MTDRFGEIASLCRAISIFQHRNNWRFKALPVIAWEFADIGDFIDARVMLENAIHASRRFSSPAEAIRFPNGHVIEMDVCGVTFRLKCVANIDTQQGIKGAAELKPYRDIQFRDIFPPNPGGMK